MPETHTNVVEAPWIARAMTIDSGAVPRKKSSVEVIIIMTLKTNGLLLDALASVKYPATTVKALELVLYLLQHAHHWILERPLRRLRTSKLTIRILDVIINIYEPSNFAGYNSPWIYCTLVFWHMQSLCKQIWKKWQHLNIVSEAIHTH